MNSKDKGNIGEAIVLAEFTKRNIQVSLPFGDNARYDLIAEFNGKLNKIQVKYCNQKISENKSISCPCASSTNHTTNKHYSTYENDIDYFVFYLVEWEEIVIIPIEEIGSKKSICFRKDLPKATNGNEIHLVQDYSFENFFNDKEKIEQKEELKKFLPKYTCIDCGVEVTKENGRCRSCAAKLQSRVVENRPSREELKEMIRTIPFIQIGKKYSVSDNAIRKWCSSYNLPKKVSEIKLYTDEEWKNI